MNDDARVRVPTFTHWGPYSVEKSGDRIVAVHAHEDDPDPSPIGHSLVDAVQHRCRIRRPAIRKGWLEHGPRLDGGGRGDEPFVEVSWDRALDLLAAELRRVKETHGNRAIFGGSYGWASAGRFHHALSQLHRFLKQHGGYTYSVNSYSTAAAQVIIPHVFGMRFLHMIDSKTAWPVIAKHSELVVMFGGIPLKNAQVNSGGVGRHVTRDWLHRCRENGVTFVNVSPLRQDAADFLDAQWLAPRPNTDTALMLGLAHTLYIEGLHDAAFLASHCEGFERFLPYLLGETDGVVKDAAWAAAICDVDADAIRALARRMAARRTLITVAWSLQRGDHGEQPYWMAAVLAAMLGQIGLPGGGVGYGYASESAVGNPVRRLSGLSLPQGENAVSDFIPVARIADLLLNPGVSFDYNGQKLTYPDIRLVYWCGGNPFHHHQDLNRLVRAWQRPETVVVHEPWWNSLARHADIVLPATTTLERNDIGRASNDNHVFAMHKALEPVGEARNDYDILAGLAARLGFGERFTEGRDEEAWLRHLYDVFRQQVARERIELPDFDTFWREGAIELPLHDPDRVLFHDFRQSPERHPLKTPSGRIEIYSETIGSFGYDDCPAHPTWLEPAEWLGGDGAGRFPLHLISNQPSTRLHSQLDLGATSIAGKVNGREAVLIHPDDAAARGIGDGDVVRLYNDRGACLAGARVTADVRRGVVVLPTGAWYDPDPESRLDRHGNPNVLTNDKGTSRLAQGPSAHTTLVDIERLAGDAPAVRIFDPVETTT
ncbi:MAG: molybdopterin guanine dinucleotide-containing S/N-oxide reductase [Gammaproteobacteria bacterium]|nr:molybdopterin guanine dinucleotide-containing S/N-oxide reductase [Gammaproteobacteria bacterium]